MFRDVSCIEISGNFTGELPEFDIVFVHGLGSNAEAAWKNETGDLWPLWIRQVVGQSRVLLLNYPASVFFSSKYSNFSIRERAINLGDYLPIIGIGLKPTIFICHSLGGIIVKEIVRASICGELPSDFASKIAGIVFLSTPHGGANIAGLVSFFGSQLTKALAKDCDYIIDLKSWFSNFSNDCSMRISNYVETQAFNGIIVVDKSSGDFGTKKVKNIPIDANHSNICKPGSPNDDIFLRVKRDMEETMRKFHKATKAIQSIDEIISLPALTNQMYFESIGHLHRIFFEQKMPAVIVSNPCGQIKPCSVIITQDPRCRSILRPLEERFPDRFAVQLGVLAEFTTNKHRGSVINEFANKKDESSLYRMMVKKIIEQISSQVDVFKVKPSVYKKTESRLHVYTTLHSFESEIRMKVENSCKNLMINFGENRSGKGRKKVLFPTDTGELNKMSIECTSMAMNDLINDNNFKIRLWDFASDEYSTNAFDCNIHSVDPKKDLLIFIINIDKENRVALNYWMENNKNLTESAVDVVSSIFGDISAVYHTPAAKGQQLKLESPSMTGFFALSDRVTSLGSLLMFSGADIEAGSSGSPIFNKDNKIIGMIVGKTKQGGESKILAVPIDASTLEREKNKQLR